MDTQPIDLTPPDHDLSTDAARYEAVRERDARAEGVFFYSVVTTGVYCRPTCAARLALRSNVEFHRTREDAERAGYRPCKRCRPRELPLRERHAQVIEAARTMLETAESPIGLKALAATVGLSPYHLHRVFKEHVGMTPRAYASAHRLQRAAGELREGASVTAAIHDAGYSSTSRFYEAGGALGMAPPALRTGGGGVAMRAVVLPCKLGLVLVAATAQGVCAIAFGDDAQVMAEQLRERFPRAQIAPSDGEPLGALAEAVVHMVDSAGLPASIPLELIGTAFQQRVWRALLAIPRGTTCTYAEIARRVGSPRAVRAVGTACGRNPVAVVVPCHRVLREDGALGGYRWGLERKKALLAQERAT